MPCKYKLLKIQSRHIDALNLFLVALSGLMAYFFPLELFLFSFAILGPLHYLTEINWLREKKYFAEQKASNWLLLALVTSAMLVIPRIYFSYWPNRLGFVADLLLQVNHFSNGLILLCLTLSIGLLFIKKKKHWLWLIFLSLLLSFFLNGLESYNILIGLLIPTVIHVYLFTLLFMLYGSKKSKSRLGYFVVLIALFIPLLFIFIPIDSSNYLFSDFLKAIYIENRFHHTPVLFSKFFGFGSGESFFFYEQLELRLMMFLSFIYLYHYLNWFSKTSIISWHKTLNAKRTVLIVLAWFCMLWLFYIDFTLGFLVALFFSFIHVILEFPLNMISIRELFKKE